jgi:hypothetical protein
MSVQTKKGSLIEASFNTVVAMIINILVTPYINMVCGINMSEQQIFGSTILFTIISVIRGYIVRRYFNSKKI